jgi:hypothetical protein
MEIQIKAYAYTIDIITEIRYFCKCNNAVFGKFRIIFTYTISKTDCSLHHSFHALFKISGNGKFVRTAVLPPHPSRNLSKSTPHPRTALNLPPLSKVRCCRPKEFGRLPEGLPHHHLSLAPTLPNPHYPSPHTNILASLVKGEVLSPEKIRATTGGIAASTLSIPTTLSKPHPSLAPHHHPRLLMNALPVSHSHYPTHFS